MLSSPTAATIWARPFRNLTAGRFGLGSNLDIDSGVASTNFGRYPPMWRVPTKSVPELVHTFFNVYGMREARRVLQRHVCTNPSVKHKPAGFIDIFSVRLLRHITRLDG